MEKSINTRISNLLGIKYPIIQGGMVWCSGWELASAVSNAGGLGIIGSGSMKPDILKLHIDRTLEATNKPIAINVPLISPYVKETMEVIFGKKIKIVFTAAGNPAVWTEKLKEKGITVVHVVGSTKFAEKAEQAGVDAVVAEGFEAGGHNSREETSTISLIPSVREAVSIPLIAAGGIASGRAMMAAMALGAEGAQIGTAFAAAKESSAHIEFKKKIIEAAEGDTKLTMKSLIPVRMLRNELFYRLEDAIARGSNRAKLMEIFGKGRPKLGMFEGDTEEGALEIGQIANQITEIRPAADIINSIVEEFYQVRKELAG